MGNSFKIGDWVNSESEGVFRIEKVIQEYDESEDTGSTGKKYDKKILVLKRLLDARYKKSLGYKLCNELCITKLNSEQRETLEGVLEKNPDLISEIDNYQIPPVKRYRSIPLKVELPEDIEKVTILISFIRLGKTFTEISNEMQNLDIQKLGETAYFGRYHLNLTNIDFQNINKQRIWSEAKLLRF